MRWAKCGLRRFGCSYCVPPAAASHVGHEAQNNVLGREVVATEEAGKETRERLARLGHWGSSLGKDLGQAGEGSPLDQ